jgi:hypothetical protein
MSEVNMERNLITVSDDWYFTSSNLAKFCTQDTKVMCLCNNNLFSTETNHCFSVVTDSRYLASET